MLTKPSDLTRDCYNFIVRFTDLEYIMQCDFDKNTIGCMKMVFYVKW
ncbi:MAG: hypothetical protein HUJ51_02765 [Eggerthellaceae bacterium]|nr:hypothetical protein [Eggerthellaceae bacterium]